MANAGLLIVTTSPGAADSDAAVVPSAFASAAVVSADAAVVLVDALLPQALSNIDAHTAADTAAIAFFFISIFLPFINTFFVSWIKTEIQLLRSPHSSYPDLQMLPRHDLRNMFWK